MAPQKNVFSFKFRLIQVHPRAYVCILNKRANSLVNITWSELGKQNIQAKKVYFRGKDFKSNILMPLSSVFAYIALSHSCFPLGLACLVFFFFFPGFSPFVTTDGPFPGLRLILGDTFFLILNYLLTEVNRCIVIHQAKDCQNLCIE